MQRDRREFVKSAALLGAAGRAMAAAEIPRRPLGRTGLQVSILGLGGAPVGRLPQEKDAVEVVRRCYDLGINYFDSAAAGAYGLSQARYGLALKGLRDKVVLATKTRHRTATQAQLDLDQSLANLRTDHLDLYQLHNIINDEDIEFIFGPRGVLEMVEKARKAGKVRFVGVTGHTDPKVLNRILERYPFDSVLMPLSVADGANRQKSFEAETVAFARKKGVAVIAMKTLSAGALLRKGVASLQESLHYVWSLPVSIAILGCGSVDQVESDVAAARSFRPLAAADVDALRRRAAGFELAGLEPWKRHLPAGDPGAYLAD
ncbi:MAG: aldo/keto reductase [Acidobacteria bacterium]|nr:aldo/keto reductase [Acidobacteriota bacterium]